ncbi:ABC transporter ATP-binding protein [Azospirillum sp. RWY-5-1]|uniref:ABC transporter ATP-binding protein n=1 Tax=Azospirillum oleiclasticum TaxID=2735135 RepID=A0ABX2T4G2_9PROT|nr:ABC transporter ATP-binding protein [Azospirillum oleiclasticum]NYZ12057.1 ABC transporter ATP-binding protein [Azospirillum oleiclasticum]NYZ19217.1 ABC transporter ATP-binding protein [Azospirillum oleiclasticum]
MPLFENLSLELPAGTVTALLGPSGVGKTTLLRMLAGLAVPEPPTRLTAHDGRPLAGRVAYMAQQDLLLPWLTALDNVTLGARLRGEPRNGAVVGRAAELLRRVGLGDRAGARPAALSGGERQRVALARTLMEDRPLVLMDEPFSALDAITRLRLQDLAAGLLAGRTVLLVTHDPLEALRIADRVLVMTGRPATIGAPLALSGDTPRAPDDPAVLALQGELLRRLAA